MHERPGDLFPVLDNSREIAVLQVGIINEDLVKLAGAYVEQKVEHNFIRGVAGKGSSPLKEFRITADTVDDVRDAARVTLERGGTEGLRLTVTGVKRAASKILNETKNIRAA